MGQVEVTPNPVSNWQWQYAKPGGQYATQLSPDEEARFQEWTKQSKVPWQDTPTADYDMRGFWKEMQVNPQGNKTSINPNDNKIHYPDKFKTPYHQSFSRESMYALPTAPKWINSHQLADDKGSIIFDELPNSGPKTNKLKDIRKQYQEK